MLKQCAAQVVDCDCDWCTSRNRTQPSEPAGLEERMAQAIRKTLRRPSDDVPNWEDCAIAALAVARAEFDQQLQQKLAERDKEWEQAVIATLIEWCFYGPNAQQKFIAGCRARLCRKPSLQERVTIEQVGIFYYVNLDGKAACLGFHKKQDAERYAAGLRAEIGGNK